MQKSTLKVRIRANTYFKGTQEVLPKYLNYGYLVHHRQDATQVTLGQHPGAVDPVTAQGAPIYERAI